MRRKQEKQIYEDLQKKMVFVSGPRQVGKTWLAKKIMSRYVHPIYLNYDFAEDRERIRGYTWPPETDLVIFDEIHKMPKWKNYLKGLFDTRLPHMRMLVTGSARLETFRHAGDSLAGRFFAHHLLPLSVAEVSAAEIPAPHLARLEERGGFPEAYLAVSAEDSAKWRSGYADSLIRGDVLDFETIHDMRAIRMIFDLLATKVGTSVSYASLARDASISPTTAKKYVDILEALYIVFRVPPHSDKLSNVIRKESKVYFYDTGFVRGDSGAIFENTVANALTKHLSGLNDFKGERNELRYARTKDGREVDFVLTKDAQPTLVVEAKVSDSSLHVPLEQFSTKYGVPGVQLVRDLRHERAVGSIEVRRAEDYLRGLFL
jgi:uncharacterized protein